MGAYGISFGIGYYFKLILSLAILIIGVVLLCKKRGKMQIVIPVIFLSAWYLLRYLWSGLVILLMLGEKRASEISIIGGGDGPTSIFLAGKLTGPTDRQFCAFGVAIAVLLWWLIQRKIKIVSNKTDK